MDKKRKNQQSQAQKIQQNRIKSQKRRRTIVRKRKTNKKTENNKKTKIIGASALLLTI